MSTTTKHGSMETNQERSHLTSPQPGRKTKIKTGIRVTDILHNDHLRVADLFFRFEQLDDNAAKEDLAHMILRELFIHSTIEEEIVYPAAREDAGEQGETDKLLDESETEHHIIKLLMAELSLMEPSDDLYDAKVCVLGELVRHHVREEEKYMFKKMKEADMDLELLAQKCMEEKEELLAMDYEEISEELQVQLKECGYSVHLKSTR